MAETIDIRELNERIERQSAFVTNLTTGMDQVIVGQKHLGRWNQVIRFLAPLVITEEQLAWGLDAMEASILACMDK